MLSSVAGFGWGPSVSSQQVAWLGRHLHWIFPKSWHEKVAPANPSDLGSVSPLFGNWQRENSRRTSSSLHQQPLISDPIANPAMRLINTSTYLFEEFIGSKIPKYAILSHTWEEEEVSFADVSSNPRFREKKGWAKIGKTCEIASEQGYKYAWVDTCCIDKSSSAELTEAINSMFQWYRRSEVCYTFLSDFDGAPPMVNGMRIPGLERCRWFTRGWTLQELIAPRRVLFFDQNWQYRFDKAEIADQLQDITRIAKDIICHLKPLSSVCVAAKMSWAAFRETTRVEDTAYCLMGLFDVNMPLLYGEEHKAFRRLQEEIIRTTPDRSVFAWSLPLPREPTPQHAMDNAMCGVFAYSPRPFAGCGFINVTPDEEDGPQEFILTHSGVKVQSRDVEERILSNGTVETRYILDLHCIQTTAATAPYSTLPRMAIALRKCGPHQFMRADPFNCVFQSGRWYFDLPGSDTRYLLTNVPDREWEAAQSAPKFTFTMDKALARRSILQIAQPEWADLDQVWPLGYFDKQDQVVFATQHFVKPFAILKLGWRWTGAFARTARSSLMFFALGWASKNIGVAEFSLISTQEYSNILQDPDIELDNHRNGHGVRRMIDYWKIPRVSAAIVDIPGTTDVWLMSFTPTLVSDTSLCQSKFWKIQFHLEKYQKGAVPMSRVVTERWREDDSYEGE